LCNNSFAGRVTRSGEFSPLERSSTLGGYLKVAKEGQLFRHLFSHGKSHALILPKIWVWLNFGLFFFTNSSGHPVRGSRVVACLPNLYSVVRRLYHSRNTLKRYRCYDFEKYYYNNYY
jgi:hypothetical protein